jgi:hypothetical protein
VYDALSVARCYKDPIAHEKCIDIIRSETGKHFDPAIVEIFLQIHTEFERIRESFLEKETVGEAVLPLSRQREVSHQLDVADGNPAIVPLLTAASTTNGSAWPFATTG